jgi:hypothetical protein
MGDSNATIGDTNFNFNQKNPLYVLSKSKDRVRNMSTLENNSSIVFSKS